MHLPYLKILAKASLAQKSALTMLAMLVYFGIASLVVAYERRTLKNSVQQLTEIHQEEERQVALNILLARSILTVDENYFSPVDEVSPKVLAIEIESLLAGLGKLQHRYASASENLAQLNAGMVRLLQQPNRAVVADIRGIFHRLVIDMDAITSDIRDRKQHILVEYEQAHDRLAIEWIFFFIVGLALLSSLMVFFLRRLAYDIKQVQKRAMDIVRGYRGQPLSIVRHDELGDLVIAVNQMQEELRKHETQIEIGRQQRFHKEKMAAIGSLSATIAHEINNPLSAIVGIAQTMQDAQQREGRKTDDASSPFDMLLEQARRVMQITRQLAEFSVPQSHQVELTDVNGLVRSTCKFVAFDRRFKGVTLLQKLDPALPAAYAVADHVVQVLMNLLINAADALDGVTDREPCITISTSLQNDAIKLEVRDNGCGIKSELIEKVFEENFTTKAPGKGSGLGLALCRTLISEDGGQISLHSELDHGTTVDLILPLSHGQTPVHALGE
jgi:two-component system, NtrC family, sensor kinase